MPNDFLVGVESADMLSKSSPEGSLTSLGRNGTLAQRDNRVIIRLSPRSPGRVICRDLSPRYMVASIDYDVLYRESVRSCAELGVSLFDITYIS